MAVVIQLWKDGEMTTCSHKTDALDLIKQGWSTKKPDDWTDDTEPIVKEKKKAVPRKPVLSDREKEELKELSGTDYNESKRMKVVKSKTSKDPAPIVDEDDTKGDEDENTDSTDSDKATKKRKTRRARK